MDKTLVAFDGVNAHEEYSREYTTFKTSIDIKNLETGEVIFKGLKNKVIIPGSGFVARKLFDLTTDEITPSYNTALNIYTPTGETAPSEDIGTTATKNNQKVVLFCCGTDGCGSESSQVYPVNYTKWIKPADLVPFRYQLASNDLSDALKKTYFGRATTNDGKYIAYYFKRFETEPKIVQQYIDGTPIDATVYDSVKTTSAETFVELSLKITKEDIRDYFVATVGIDEAKINSISLCTGYPVEESGQVYFKEIRPITKLNIPNESLIDVTKGIEIIYHIYM